MDFLEELFKFHDELSMETVFNDNDQERQIAFTKAESLRELAGRLSETLSAKDQEKYIEAVQAHYKSISKSVFYNRRLTFKK